MGSTRHGESHNLSHRLRRFLLLTAALLACWAIPGSSQTGTLAPWVQQTYLTANGTVCASCRLYTYIAGTTTALATYSDAALSSQHANPIILSSTGRIPTGGLFLLPRSYKFVLKTSADAEVWSLDGVSALPPFFVDLDVTGIAGEALIRGTPAYMSDGSGSKTAGSWYEADANETYSSSTASLVGVAVAACASGATDCAFRLQGRMDDLFGGGFAGGTTIYIAAGGGYDDVAPANARTIGVANGLTSLFIAPRQAPGGTIVVGGDIVFTTSTTLRHDTEDAADNRSLPIAAGGAANTDRGAIINLFGNENAATGQIRYRVGNVSGSEHQFFRSDGVKSLGILGTTGLATFAHAMALTPQASAPGTPTSGTIYVDSTASPDELCFYDGAAWQGISSGTDGNCS